MNNSEILRELLQYLLERRNVEYKSSVPWQANDFKAKITKTILGLSNIRDGGYILIGIEDNGDGTFNNTGVTDPDFDTYNHDDITSHVSNYADPYVTFEVHKEEIEGRKYVLITVSEFNEMPVICKRPYSSASSGEILKQGIIYTRSQGKPETIAVPSQSEMREIIEIAVEKRYRRIREITGKAEEVEEVDQERFKDQLKDLEGDE